MFTFQRSFNMTYSKFTPVTFGYIKSEIEKLSDQFKSGVNFTMELSSKVYRSFSVTSDLSYMDDIAYIKHVLNAAKKRFTRDVFYMKTNLELTDSQKQLVVRYINICHPDKEKVIVINNTIVDKTDVFYGYDELSVLVYIHKSLRIFNKARKADIAKERQYRTTKHIGSELAY